MTHASALVAVALALAKQPSSAHDLQVSVEIDPCLAVAKSEVLRLTALELDARVVSRAEARPTATHVEVSCAGRHVRLRVTDPVTGKSLERTLALVTTEVDVAGRAVALAVAELVLTSWMELTMPDPPPRSATLEPPPPGVQKAAANRALELTPPAVRVERVLALGQATGPYDGFGIGSGGGARLTLSYGPRWLMGDVDFTVSQSEADTALGRVRASTWSSALRGSVELDLDAGWLEAGAGGRVGIARLSGSPSNSEATRGGVVAGVFGGPTLHAGGGLKLWHVALALGLEAGFALRGVSGLVEDGDPVAIKGAWVSASAGVGWTR